MNRTITKLTTIALTLFLATNLCAMEDGVGTPSPVKRKREEGASSYLPIKKIDIETTDYGTQTDQTAEQQALAYLLNEPDGNDQTVLHRAIDRNDDERIKDLVKAGANINKENKDGLTLLVRLVCSPDDYKFKRKIDLALKHGADIFRRSAKTGLSVLDTVEANMSSTVQRGMRRPPLSAFVSNTKQTIQTEYHNRLLATIICLKRKGTPKDILAEILGRLLENSVFNLNKTIKTLAMPGDIKIAALQKIITRYLSTNPSILDMEEDSLGTPLHAAATAGRLDLAQFLIDKGAEVNIKDKFGRTPLHSAANSDIINIVQFLIDKGAKVNIKDKFGCTPLHNAAAGPIAFGLIEDNNVPWTDKVKAMIANGAEINDTDNQGQTPLHITLEYWDDEIDTTRYLLTKGADANAQDKKGRTPLHITYINESDGIEEIRQLLEECGADPTIKDKEGKTPLDYKR